MMFMAERHRLLTGNVLPRDVTRIACPDESGEADRDRHEEAAPESRERRGAQSPVSGDRADAQTYSPALGPR